LGVSYTLLTKEFSVLRNMPEGAFVQVVVPDSPADKAKLQRGDIILKIDDVRLDSESNTLGKIISGKKVGDKIALTIDRDGEELVFSATLEEFLE
jgi:S1-C subfamily serine protease